MKKLNPINFTCRPQKILKASSQAFHLPSSTLPVFHSPTLHLPSFRSSRLSPKIILQGLLAILIFALSACQAALPEPPEPPAPVIVLWHPFIGEEAAAIQRLGDRFTAENPRHINLIVEYQQNIAQKLTGDPESRPDLLIVWPEEAREYQTAGYSVAPTPLPISSTVDMADLLPMAQALYNDKGRLNAIPLGLATYVAYYNKDWLNDLGYETMPTRFGILTEIACKATDVQANQNGATLPSQAGMFLALMSAQGSPLMTGEGYYQFDDPLSLQAGDGLQTLLSSNCGSVYEISGVGIDRLGNSTLPILMESSLNRKAIERAVAAHRNFALAMSALPGPQDLGPTLWYGPGLALTAPEGPRREAAREALAWFLSAGAQEEWSTSTNYLPVRRSLIENRQELLESEKSTSLEPALIALTLDTAEKGNWISWPRRSHYATCRAALVRTLASFGKKTPPAELLSQAQAQCNTGGNP